MSAAIERASEEIARATQETMRQIMRARFIDNARRARERGVRLGPRPKVGDEAWSFIADMSLSGGEAAKRAGVSETTVFRYRARAGLGSYQRSRRSGFVDAIVNHELSTTDAARAALCRPDTIATWRRRLGMRLVLRDWTDSERALINDRGLGICEVARRLGISPSQVSIYRRRGIRPFHVRRWAAIKPCA